MPTLAALAIEPMPSTIVQKMTGTDHHLDQVDEALAERGQLDGEVLEQQAHDHTENHRHDDRDIQIVGAVLLRRRRLPTKLDLWADSGARPDMTGLLCSDHVT